MQVNFNSNTNFKGGFRFPSMIAEAREKLPAITKRKQIFYDFEKPGDVFLLVKKETDYQVAKFIRENKVPFIYYPQLDTKCGFDTERPSELSEKLKTMKPSSAQSRTSLKKAIADNLKLDEINRTKTDYIDKILNGLCIDNKEENKKTLYKGAVIVTDNEFKRKIYISPSDKSIHYVIVKPDLKTESIKRYAMDSEGNILSTYNTPEGIQRFNKMFQGKLLNNQ